MLKKVVIAVVAFFSLIAFVGPGYTQASETSQPFRATWLWNPWMFVEDETGTLAFIESKSVNKVYVQVDQDISKAAYSSFIGKAKSKGIDIYALDGAPSWVAPKAYVNQDRFLAWVSDYQVQAAENTRFAGVHLDVEPYLYSGWKTNQAATIKSFQTLLERANRSTAQMGLPLEADIPFWFDEIQYKNTFGKGQLAEWVIANTAGVAIMAYRDSAPMIIDIVKNEMAMAQRLGKSVVVGVETDVTDEGSIITFAEEGEAFMNQELAKVTAHYAGNPAYKGNAIHHVGSWMTLRP
ncbi:amidase [Planococcus salinarum]|uniref:amidase n=1 Tax=Planococcus salinarum TaxID=622695 RepID=UPI000E3E2080|nr:amidase [Planococcus salinarum]TAA67902.1 amidase [Planococcus salinarum]